LIIVMISPVILNCKTPLTPTCDKIVYPHWALYNCANTAMLTRDKNEQTKENIV